METQEIFDQAMANGLKIVHSSEVTNTIIKRVTDSNDPVTEIGVVTVNVVSRIEESGTENKIEIPANVVLNIINIVAGEIITIAETAGMQPLDEEQRYQVISYAISSYIDTAVKTGKVSKEQLLELKQAVDDQSDPVDEERIAQTNQVFMGAEGNQPMPGQQRNPGGQSMPGGV